MRDYRNIDLYLSELLDDIYPQPPDPVHTEMAQEIIQKWITKMVDLHTVLDVGCGQGFAQPMFEELGISYTGVTLGSDYVEAKKLGYNVLHQDFSFLSFPDKSFDMIFSRHSLEHSPFPLLTLMEWNRVAKAWLLLVLPTPRVWQWGGRNHYGLMSISQARFLLDRAGWKPLWEDHTDRREFRFLCQKYDRVGLVDDKVEEYEGNEPDEIGGDSSDEERGT